MTVCPEASIPQAACSAGVVIRQEFHPMHTLTVANQ
jgi:hypothetical protein